MEGARIYLRKAIDFHLLKALVWASRCCPDAETVRFIPQHIQITKTEGIGQGLSKKFREMGERSGEQKSGPGEVPLKFK